MSALLKAEKPGLLHKSVPPAALTTGAILTLVVMNVFWGASSVAAKYSMTSFGPMSVAVMRFFPSGVIVLLWSYLRGDRIQIRGRDWLVLCYMGTVGIALTYFLFYTGMQGATATEASMLFACEPLLIALFAWLFLRERLSKRQWGGLSIGLVGISLIVGLGMGNLMMAASVCVETTASIAGKRLSGRYPGLQICGIEMLIGSMLLMPMAWRECQTSHGPVTMTAVASVLYLSLICSAVCFALWYILVEKYPVSTIGIFILVQPTVGPFFGWLLRGEHLKPTTAMGGALVVLGIGLTMLPSGRRRIRALLEPAPIRHQG